MGDARLLGGGGPDGGVDVLRGGIAFGSGHIVESYTSLA